MEKLSTYFDGSSAAAVQRGVESAGDALHTSIDKVADPARDAVNNLSSTAHETVDKLATRAGHTASRLADQTRRLAEVPVKALERSTSWVQENPLESVGAALALGFILGRLTAR